jgi:glycosyltransferase involved in cell wall biosynthesis
VTSGAPESNRVVIPAPPSGQHRPLWSVLIPTWNCAAYLEEALQSVLIQDPGEQHMEIIVVDDYSTKDDPREVVSRIAGSRVRFIQQQENVGKVRNYETGLVSSRGRLIHQLHGDDRVRPGFYAVMEDAFTDFPRAGAFFCASSYIDASGNVTGRTGGELPVVGILENWLDKIFVEQRIQTPSIVLRREVYETLGGFDRRLDAFEDWEMWIRAATQFPVGFIPDVLAEYRVASGSATELTTLSGMNARTLRLVLSLVDEYVPQDLLARLRNARNRAQAQYLIQFIPKLVQMNLYGEALRTGYDALSFSSDPRTVYRMLNYALTARQKSA